MPSTRATATSGQRLPLPKGMCAVDVHATPIKISRALVGPHQGASVAHLAAEDMLLIWHLFIVYTDAAGVEFFFRGGPQRDSALNFGAITVHEGLYVPGTIDWNPQVRTRRIAMGMDVCGKDADLRAELVKIAALHVPYRVGGPNSNTVARTLLSKCGLPLLEPPGSAPGWRHPNL